MGHGPGQLVGYPIVKLAPGIPARDYADILQAALICACVRVGVRTGRLAGRPGVWLEGQKRPLKSASIGVRLSEGVTMHGFALNCDSDLTAFSLINPCGDSDARTTSLTLAAGRLIGVRDRMPIAREELTTGLMGVIEPTRREALGPAPWRPRQRTDGDVLLLTGEA